MKNRFPLYRRNIMQGETVFMQKKRNKKMGKRSYSKQIRLLIYAGIVICAAAAAFCAWKIGRFKAEKNSEPAAAVEQTQEVQAETVQETADTNEEQRDKRPADWVNPLPKPQIEEEFLTPNEYSRPQEKLEAVTEIFIHYTANPGTTALQNRSYFENLGSTGETSASAHYVIGYEGEIIQCLPLKEIGYAVKEHNYNSVSIECCYLDESGVFTEATRQSLIELTAWLLMEYDLGIFDVKRHFDAGGKPCPVYYVENPDEWEYLLADIDIYLENTLIGNKDFEYME